MEAPEIYSCTIQNAGLKTYLRAKVRSVQGTYRSFTWYLTYPDGTTRTYFMTTEEYLSYREESLDGPEICVIDNIYGKFSIKVRAHGANDQSVVSEPFLFHSKKPNIIQLPVPDWGYRTTSDGFEVECYDVANALGYTIVITNPDGTETQCDNRIAPHHWDGYGNYLVKVKAVGNNANVFDSEYSSQGSIHHSVPFTPPPVTPADPTPYIPLVPCTEIYREIQESNADGWYGAIRYDPTITGYNPYNLFIKYFSQEEGIYNYTDQDVYDNRGGSGLLTCLFGNREYNSREEILVTYSGDLSNYDPANGWMESNLRRCYPISPGEFKVQSGGNETTSSAPRYVYIFSTIDCKGYNTPPKVFVKICLDYSRPNITSPVITLNGSSEVNHIVGTTFIDPGATAYDQYDLDLTNQITTSGVLDTNTDGRYVRTYSVTNSIGKISKVARTINVVLPALEPVTNPTVETTDTTAIINHQTVPYADKYRYYYGDSKKSVKDKRFESSCNDNGYSNHFYELIPNTRYFFMIVSESNSTQIASCDSEVFEFTTKRETVPPVVTLVGPSTVNIETRVFLDYPLIELFLNNLWRDPGATAYDATVGCNLKVEVKGHNAPLVNAPSWTYKIVYTATDRSGNIGTATRTVIVSQPTDTTPPVITLSGEDIVTLTVGDTFTDPGATATDETDGTLVPTVSGTVNTSVPGTYTLTYSATDSCGNTGTNKRIVIVQATQQPPADTTPPVIELLGQAEEQIWVGGTWTDPGALAVDAVDGRLEITTTGTVDTTTAGTYTKTYSATDSSDNTASKTRQVIVQAVDPPTDMTPPVIKLSEYAFRLPVGSDWTNPGPGIVASDNIDGDITDQIQTEGTVDTSTPGKYRLRHSVTNSSGKTAAVTRTVEIYGITPVTPPTVWVPPIDVPDPSEEVLDPTGMKAWVVKSEKPNENEYLKIYDAWYNFASGYIQVYAGYANDHHTYDEDHDGPNGNSAISGYYNRNLASVDAGTFHNAVRLPPMIEVINEGTNESEWIYDPSWNPPRLNELFDRICLYNTMIDVDGIRNYITSPYADLTHTLQYLIHDKPGWDPEIVARRYYSSDTSMLYIPYAVYNGHWENDRFQDWANYNYDQATIVVPSVRSIDKYLHPEKYVPRKIYLKFLSLTQQEQDETETIDLGPLIFISLSGARYAKRVSSFMKWEYGPTQTDWTSRFSANGDNIYFTMFSNYYQGHCNISKYGSDETIASFQYLSDVPVLFPDLDFGTYILSFDNNVGIAVIAPILVKSVVAGDRLCIGTLSEEDLLGGHKYQGRFYVQSKNKNYYLSNSNIEVCSLNQTAGTIEMIDIIYRYVPVGETDYIDAKQRVEITYIDPEQHDAQGYVCYTDPDTSTLGETYSYRVVVRDGASRSISNIDSVTVVPAYIGFNDTSEKTDSTVYSYRVVAVDNNGLDICESNADTVTTHDGLPNIITYTDESEKTGFTPYSYRVNVVENSGFDTYLSNTRTVRTPAEEDTEPPVVALRGLASITLTVGDDWTDPGAIALDAVDGRLEITTTGTVDTTTAGTYTRTYTATDAAGNIGTATRTVAVQAAVVDPPEPPLETLGLIVSFDPNYTSTNGLNECAYAIDATTGFTLSNLYNDSTFHLYWSAVPLTMGAGITGLIDDETLIDAGTFEAIKTIADINAVGTYYLTSGVQSGTVQEILEVVVNTTSPGAQLAAPGALALTITPTSIAFNIPAQSESANASSYMVKFATSKEGLATAAEEVLSGTITKTNLTPNTPYYISAKAVGDGTNYSDSIWTIAGAAYTAQLPQLNAPTLTCTSTDTTITPTIGTVEGAASYKIRYSTETPSGDGTTWTSGTAITGLTAETQYSVQVLAVGNGTSNLDSNWSEAVAISTAQAPPEPIQLSAPTITGATKTTESIVLTFSAVENASSYKIRYGTANPPLGDGSAYTSGTAISGLEPDTSYYFQLKSVGNGTTYTNSDWGDVYMASTNPEPDTTAPVVSLNGSASITLTVGDNWIDPGATATDSVDGTLVPTATGEVDTETAGTYTITYSASDSSGNIGTATRTIIVNEPPDETAPVITLIGDSTIRILVGQSWTDPGATATDDRDGDLTDAIETEGEVDTSTAGTYTRTYTATDAAGNRHEITRYVIVDNPTIRLNQTGDGLTADNGLSAGVYGVRVRSTDSGGESVEKTLRVYVNPSNNPPTNITLTPDSVVLVPGQDTEIGELITEDPDAGDTHSYQILSVNNIANTPDDVILDEWIVERNPDAVIEIAPNRFPAFRAKIFNKETLENYSRSMLPASGVYAGFGAAPISYTIQRNNVNNIIGFADGSYSNVIGFVNVPIPSTALSMGTLRNGINFGFIPGIVEGHFPFSSSGLYRLNVCINQEVPIIFSYTVRVL